MDEDLQLLRAFRADELIEPEGLAARCEEDLWRAILAEEAGGRAAGRQLPRGGFLERWRGSMLRPAAAFGVAAMLAGVVAIASDGGAGGAQPPGATVRQAEAGVLDSTVRSLFGSDAAAATAGIAGAIDIRDASEERDALAIGPTLTRDDELDGRSSAAAAAAPRDPIELLASLRAAASDATGGSDSGDRVAFTMAMRWVAEPAVPDDLRAAMLRSVEGMAGLDGAAQGADVLGRAGVVVSHLDRSSGIRDQFLLDGTDGRLREYRAFTADYLDPACPPLTFTAHTVYDEAGEPIDPASLPYIDWPQVVEVCDPAATVG